MELSDDHRDTAQLIESGQGSATADDSESPKVLYKYRYYTLPAIRLSTAVRLILFVDTVLTIILWVLGGNGEYFVDNIIHFHYLQSTFDLVLLTNFKCITLFVLYSSLEDATLKVIKNPAKVSHRTKKKGIHIAIILLSFIFLAYAFCKGGFVLNLYLNGPDDKRMHLLYNILLLCSAILTLVEFILSLCTFHAMKALQTQRVLHRLNEHFQEVDEEGKVLEKKVNIIRLISLIKGEGRLLVFAIFCLLGSTASQTAAPLFFGMVVDAALTSMAKLNQTVLILLLIYIGGAILSMGRSWLFTLAGQRMVARLRKDLFKAIIRQEVAFFDVNRTGELTNRLASDTQVLQNAVTANISMLTRYILQILGSLVFMFVLNASLTGVLLAIIPIISLGAVQYGKFVQRVRKSFQDRLAEASTTAEESISSIRTVRSFVGESQASATYGESVDKSYKEGKKLAMAQGTFEGVIGMIVAGAVTLVLWYGGKLVSDGTLTAGVLTSFLLYMLNVAFAFGLLSSLYGDFMQAVGASIRIFQLFDRLPTVPNEGGLELANLEGGLSFQDVNFTYPSRPDNKVLEGVTFHVKRGEMVALVGPSGGGKSTIVSLIERFYDPDSGTIRLGDTDLTLLDPQWFRRQMATVSQEPTLFACSIKDNITYGREASLEEVEEAAKQANAHEFIMTFEDKYDTLVGERGVRLSGGQKQRVAIARALIMNPDILLLDEATSALDAESEHLVQEAIDRAMVNRTVLVIAHRLSTVRNAHKVIVIEKGGIVEQGTHDDLIDKNGVYKRLVLRQLTAGQSKQDVEIKDTKSEPENLTKESDSCSDTEKDKS